MIKILNMLCVCCLYQCSVKQNYECYSHDNVDNKNILNYTINIFTMVLVLLIDSVIIEIIRIHLKYSTQRPYMQLFL